MNRIRQVVILVLAGWFIFNLVQTVTYVLADYSQIPVMDYWRVVQLWANPETVRWSNLWQQHNEHRIVFPELIYIIDMSWLHGRMYLPIAVGAACYLGMWCVLVAAAYSQKAVAWPARELALLLAGIVISWKASSTVIATPFQMVFPMLLLTSMIAFLALSRLAETGQARYLAAVITTGVICTYTVGNGMLLWIVLVVCALFLRIRISQILVLFGSAAIATGIYFLHYRFFPSAMKTNVAHPVQALAFLCSYLSMPFGGYGSPTYGFKIGALNLLIMASCAVIAGRRDLLRTRLAVVLFGTYLFILMSALLTTFGRMDLNDYLFTQAKAWRYVTMPTVTWALVAVAAIWLAGEIGSRHWPMLATLAFALLLYVGFKRATDWVETTRLDSANAQITATMLRANVFDPNQVRTIFPDAEFVRVYSKVMRETHKSIYSHGDDKWIGGNLLSLPLNPSPVEGKITRVIPVPGGLQIFGWADTTGLTADHEVLFVDDQNRIAGFGRRPAAGLPVNVSAWDTPNLLAFVGYVSLSSPVTKLSAYVRTFHGKVVQPIDQKLDLPAFTQLDTKMDSATLSGMTWIRDANWTEGGYIIDPENGVAPKQSVYASWSGSDVKTGAIRSAPFKKPAGGCLLLPVLHGTATYGQSVEVIDSDSLQPIAKLRFLDGRTIWERWLIPIPAATQNISIAASDQGTGPNQWLAIATPEVCQAAQ